jgi:hypothetical protein
MVAFGVLAIINGLVGLLQPEALLALLGFETVAADQRAAGDHTMTFMAASAMASLNMGVYYLVAAVTDWQPFFRFTVAFRMVTVLVFTMLVITETAPARFIGVALWEGIGAAATGIALWWDACRTARGLATMSGAGR